jgi:hypothetical protein
MKKLYCLVLASSILTGALQVNTARAANGTWTNLDGGQLG